MSNLEPELRDIWADAFHFHAAFEHMGDSVEDWQKCYDAALSVSRKHKDHPLATELLVAVYTYMDGQRKKNREKGGDQT